MESVPRARQALDMRKHSAACSKEKGEVAHAGDLPFWVGAAVAYCSPSVGVVELSAFAPRMPSWRRST